MAKKTKADLEDEVAKRDAIIESVREAVMNWPDGCDEGKRDFLKNCGIEPPAAPRPVTIAVPVVFTLTDPTRPDAAGTTEVALGHIQQMLDNADWVHGLSGYCGAPVSFGDQDADDVCDSVVVAVGEPPGLLDACVVIDNEREGGED